MQHEDFEYTELNQKKVSRASKKESLRKQWPTERLESTFQGDILVAQISVAQKDYFVWETEREKTICQNKEEERKWADKGCHSA